MFVILVWACVHGNLSSAKQVSKTLGNGKPFLMPVQSQADLVLASPGCKVPSGFTAQTLTQEIEGSMPNLWERLQVYVIMLTCAVNLALWIEIMQVARISLTSVELNCPLGLVHWKLSVCLEGDASPWLFPCYKTTKAWYCMSPRI